MSKKLKEIQIEHGLSDRIANTGIDLYSSIVNQIAAEIDRLQAKEEQK